MLELLALSLSRGNSARSIEKFDFPSFETKLDLDKFQIDA